MNNRQGKVDGITKEISQVGGNQLTSPEDAAIYLINFDGQVALVDAGCGDAQDRLLTNIHSCGINLEQIEYLLVTHCHYDHTGGVKALKDRFNFKIVAHELESPFLEQGDNVVTAAQWYGAKIQPLIVDLKIFGRQAEISLVNRIIQALNTPGHSPGSI
jgi:glyoxylase-like metal-dependent hydrolase (beta-lactamase superfamily II)